MNIVNVGYDSTNYYALGAGSSRLLVDVGWPGTLPRLLAVLKRKDIPFADIGYLQWPFTVSASWSASVMIRIGE